MENKYISLSEFIIELQKYENEFGDREVMSVGAFQSNNSKGFNINLRDNNDCMGKDLKIVSVKR